MYYYSTLRAFFLLILCTTVLGAIFYLFNGLTLGSVAAVLLLSVGGLVCFEHYFPPDTSQTESHTGRPFFVLLNSILVIFCAILIYYLVRHAGDAAVRTPWTAVGPKFYFGLFLTLGLTMGLVVRKALHPLALSAVLFVVFGVALLIFPYGLGYDPHVHQAAEKNIALEGSIYPLHLYYSGQYALVVIAQKLFDGSGFALIGTIDSFLVPLLAALFIPFIFFWRFRRASASMALLSTPLVGLFILTTPQALSYLFFLFLAVLLFTFDDSRMCLSDVVLCGLLALAAFFVHPLTGIPAFGLLALFSVARVNLKTNTKKILTILFSLGTTLALPAAFLFNEYRAVGAFPGAEELLRRAADISFVTDISRFLHNYFSFTFNAVYGVQLVLWPVFFACVFVGWRTYRRHNIHGLFAMLMLASGVLLFLFNRHPLVIEYEQFDYAGRLFILATLSLLPFFAATFVKIFEITRQQFLTCKLFFVTLSALFALSVAYLAYPRVDRAVSTHAYATRSADVATVQAIAQNASEIPYAVLANQQVSAAALDIHGFRAPNVTTYFETSEGQSYFYPIPTGGQLYSYYLSMVNDVPSRDTVQAAMNFMKIDRLYFVVSDYWWRAGDLRAAAARIADESFVVDGGKNEVFVFER